MYVSQEVCLPIPEGSGKLACYLTELHAETGRERETSERTNSEKTTRSGGRISACVCVAGGREPALDLGSCNIRISGNADDIFFYLLPLRSNWTKDLGNRRPFAAWGVNMERL